MKLDRIFTSHMVFAAGKPIRIWGEGSGCGNITFAGEEMHFCAIGNRWEVEFAARPYGGPYELRAELGGETVVLEDIMVGEVYLIAGQSNMQFKLKDSNNADMVADLSLDIRMYSPERLEANEPITPEDGWVKNGDRIGDWTAVGYLLGDAVARQKDVAVGLVACYQGASCIESWVPEGTFEKMGICLTPEQKHHDHFASLFLKWNDDGHLYRFAFRQIVPFQFNAIIWYQGESDTTVAEGEVYAAELAKMIDIWREDLRDAELPFVIVQIADFNPRSDEGWRLVQKAQIDVQSMRENVITVISKDICETDDIHPKTKGPLAERIAAALERF